MFILNEIHLHFILFIFAVSGQWTHYNAEVANQNSISFVYTFDRARVYTAVRAATVRARYRE